MRKSFRSLHPLALLAVWLMAPVTLHAVSWFPFGPDGGDARSFAPDPHDHKHVYLGTATGWIYETRNGGRDWARLARVGNRDDLVLDNIVVDGVNPNRIFVGAWVLDRPEGGLYISNDGGKTWVDNASMHGQSVRSLTAAPSNPKILVAGTLEGVFRSKDGGDHWTLISPRGSAELHEVESIAIDPTDPQIIYAGTWHLPWRTSDGGAHWRNMNQGIIDDSDVFSIIVHPTNPKLIYASACSGIYKSGDGGDRFTKIAGIPSTARRTRVLMQDPAHLDTVFAGTTEGLWRTSDAGAGWRRTTDPAAIINDVFVDPEQPDHVLLATDRGGVLLSDDAGFSFRPSNHGFSSRQIISYAADERNPARLLVGVINDKEAGGVFTSSNGGLTWDQLSAGLSSLDVLSMVQAPDGTFLAGTSHGIFRLKDYQWLPSGTVTSGSTAPVMLPASEARASRGRSSAHGAARRPVITRPQVARPVSGRTLDATVHALVRAGNMLYGVTSSGVYSSADSGLSWHSEALTGSEWRFAAAAGANHVVIAGLRELAVYQPGTHSWKGVPLPSGLSQVYALAVSDTGEIWAGGREGAFILTGSAWQPVPGLQLTDINSIHFDPAAGRMLLTANSSTTMAYAVNVAEKKITWWDTGWHLRFVRPVGDHLVAATLYDGIVVQPRMVVSGEGARSASR